MDLSHLVHALSRSGRPRRRIIFVFCLLLGILGATAGCKGEHQVSGLSADVEIPATVVDARASRQTGLHPATATGDPKQILFGDLHVHTTFSPDAFMTSLPMMGGSGLHPPADACDFARLCADLDFWSINDHAEGISPRHWSETIDSIAECNARAGDPNDPDSVAFLGWEWSQVGGTPEDHYGHKNVILFETDRDLVPRRPIAAPRPEFRVAAFPFVGRVLFSMADFSNRQIYSDYALYAEEVASVPYCQPGVDPLELPLDCHEVAVDPKELHEKLDRWDTPSIVIPHGTSWGLMTPRGFSLARELESGQHDPDRQLLFEIYSGHGSAEVYRDWPGAFATGEDALICPEPSPDYLPCCWRAGEVIRARCEREEMSDPNAPNCEAREVEARELYLRAGAAGHLSVPGADVDDWLDCDQCRDCFNPAFSHRPGGSAQSALALRSVDETGEEQAFRFGFIGASDTHDARAGNGFKEFARLENTEAMSRSPLTRFFMGNGAEPEARSREIKLEDVPLTGRRDLERGASFLLTGGLAAVHSQSRRRESIWSAFEAREVYATSGDRILLWFDLLNGPGGEAPMGSVITQQRAAPVFRVKAAGAFEQKPGCPDFVGQALGPERLEAVCLGECYHPGDRRHAIDRLEIVRIRAQSDARESIETRVEDPWQVFECEDVGEGCRAEFVDPDFDPSDPEGGEVIYYARAIQEATPAVNGGGFRCSFDAEGNCVSVNPCYTDARTSREDDCLSDNEEHAWSSPIFVRTR
ncbi:MAG: DUF3604 domain-containing protein [bacterium]|nr:hypothetical protein [Deltaproteobacteria bacterium]MCP4904708.1 DUF3604 domain-containing protein [bacterium]